MLKKEKAKKRRKKKLEKKGGEGEGILIFAENFEL